MLRQLPQHTIKLSGLEPGHLTIDDIVFKIGPRINAAGRISKADVALELLGSSIHYPQLTGLSDPAVQQTVNAAIMAHYKLLKEDMTIPASRPVKHIFIAALNRSEDDARNVVLNDMNQPFTAYALDDAAMAKWEKIIAVRGNCEAEVDSLMLDFPVTPDYAVLFDGSTTIYCSHGHRDEPKMAEGSVYLTGHTHIPHDFVKDGVRYLNPGSVSIPKDGSHSCLVYEDGEFTVRILED